MIVLHCTVESYPIAGRFVIARGAKTQADVVVVTLADGDVSGRGECVPYARYGESVASVVAAIDAMRPVVLGGMDRHALLQAMPAGAARNAIDCALWDFEAKQSGQPAFVRAGLPGMVGAITAFTISVGTPQEMAAAARLARARPLLKIKLAGEGDEARLEAVRDAAPDATLIVDANEAWVDCDLARMIDVCADLGVALIEQPLPAGADVMLGGLRHRVPICADESMHARPGLAALRNRYDAINVKLDKAGGLTEALLVCAAAKALGFDIMVGCMVATSLAMAPAMLLAPHARFVDLDGPLLLAKDRPDGLRYEGSMIEPPSPALWG